MQGVPADVRPLAVFLMGPTASGKTTLACALRERLAALEIISVDSALVYRGMDIGTAKPKAATLAQHRHALVDIRDPEKPYSVADFRADALSAMYRIERKGGVPLLVGGTGLYFHALQRGLSVLPKADPQLRERLMLAAATHGWGAMHQRLAELDPLAARRIHPADKQRVQRALEVIALTGRSLSTQQSGRQGRPFAWRVLKLALFPMDRARLYARIGARFDTMLTSGLIDEVRAFHCRGDLDPTLPAMRAVGYRQVWDYLDGHGDYGWMRQRGIFVTRQLAKRQLTWLRSQRDVRMLAVEASGLEQQALDALQLFLGHI